MSSEYSTLTEILSREYNAGPGIFNTLPILWAADKMSDTEQAKRELTKLNRKREKMGLPGAYFEFGHRLF